MNPNTQTQVTQTLTGMPPVVGVVMGSSSDWDVMQHAVHVLKQLGVPHEARPLGHARHVGDVADEVLGPVEGAAGRFGQQRRVARTEADDGEAAAHGRRPSPGTSTIEK